MPIPEAKKALQLFAHMEEERSTWENTNELIARNIMGANDGWVTEHMDGTVLNNRIYDNTSLLANNLLAASLDTFLTNSAAPFFRLVPEDDNVLKFEQAALWYDYADKIMLAELNKPQARFSPQNHEVYGDMIPYGQGCMFVGDEVGEGLLFSARPANEIFIAEDEAGRVSQVWRKFKFTHEQAVEKWGAEKLPKIAKKMESNPFHKSEFVHWMRKSDNVIHGNIDASGREWIGSYMSIEDKTYLEHEGFHENPYMTPRWSKQSAEVYGRGPGYYALSQAMALNEMKKTVLSAAQKAVRPPLLVEDDSVISKLTQAPGAVVTYRPTTMNRVPVQPFGHEGRVDVGVEMIDRERVQARSAYHHEMLQLWSDPRMTATQVLELVDRSQKLLSPMLGRMEVEYLSPMLTRCFNILQRQGKFPEPPQELIETGVKIEYQSPVARAQKAGLAQGIVDFFTVTANLAGAYPAALDIANVDEGLREYAHTKDVPINSVRSREDVAEVREIRAEQEAQQQQLQQGLAVADSASKLIPAVQGGQQAQ